MLTDVIAESLSTIVGQEWLKTQAIAQSTEWQIDLLGNLEFQQQDVRWSSGRIIKLLGKSQPKIVIPLLWELNRQYDDGNQTSTFLRNAVEKKCRCKLEAAPFYRHGHVLVLTCVTEKLPDTLDEIKCKTHEDKLVLHPSIWLRDVLVEFLKERSLSTTPG